VAAAGVGLMLVATRLPAAAASQGSPVSEELLRIGAWSALWPTLLQWVAGVIVLAQLSPAAREALLGGDMVATTLFALALVASLGLLHVLAAAALGPAQPQAALRSAGLLALVVLLMVGTLQRARAAERASFRSAQAPCGPTLTRVSLGEVSDA
jgi:hypothetical protein